MGIVSKNDFSKIYRLTRSAVTMATKRGVITEKDGGIDLDDERTQAYIKKRLKRKGVVKNGVKIGSISTQSSADEIDDGIPDKLKSTPKPPPQPPTEREYNDEEISSAMNKLTLERRKLAAQAQQLELKNAQIEGRLVAREVMIRGVWNPLETFLVRLQTDGAKTITSTAYALIRSGIEAELRGEKGVPREDVEVAVRGELSSLIKPLKRDIKKALLEDVQH
jgi:hypothetical protein